MVVMLNEEGIISIIECDYSKEIKGSGLENDFCNSVTSVNRIVVIFFVIFWCFLFLYERTEMKNPLNREI